MKRMLGLTLALVAAPAAAQGDKLREMQPDRPNRTNTPTTIDAGHFQVEVGVFGTMLDRDGPDDRTRDWSIGETNVRVGVTDRLELNAVVAPHVVSHERGQDYASGFGDTIVGLKWNLAQPDGKGVSIALQPQVTLPTAAHGLGDGHVEVVVNLPVHTDLPAGFGIGVMPQVSWQRDDANTRYVAGWQASAALDHQLGPADLYVEYAWHDTSEAGAPAEHVLGLGGTVALGKNIVADAGTELGLSRGADDVALFTGVSARF